MVVDDVVVVDVIDIVVVVVVVVADVVDDVLDVVLAVDTTVNESLKKTVIGKQYIGDCTDALQINRMVRSSQKFRSSTCPLPQHNTSEVRLDQWLVSNFL